MDEKLAFTPATEMRELIATKQVSPVEITELYFDRIERLDSQLNSYLTLDRDGAMKTAKAAEEAVIRGDELGLLHGIPISVKDLEMTKGIRTTRGSLVHKDDVPDVDSPVVERVRQAGAVILGKTNCSEFGALGVNQNLLGDHCRNPWNTDRTTGASSGGAGAAMAASLCSLATGGDGGGSIRIPCSFCGIYGIKPTQGRVPKYVAPGAPYAINLFAQSGPMTRTVRDSALLLQAMAGYHPMDPTTMRETPPDFMAAVDRDIKGLRIAWSPDFGYAGVEPEVAEVTAAAATVFEELGCSVEESNLDLEGSWDTYWPISAASQLSAGGHLLEKAADQLTWYVREGIEAGLDVSGMDYTPGRWQSGRTCGSKWRTCSKSTTCCFRPRCR